MILSALVSLVASLPFGFSCPQATPPSAGESAQVHELHLHDIADFIDPRGALQESLAKTMLRATLVASLNDPDAREQLSGVDSIALSLLGLALDEEEDGHQFAQDSLSFRTWLEANQRKDYYPFESVESLLKAVKSYMVPRFEGSGSRLKVELQQGKPMLLAFLTPEQEVWLQKFFQLQATQPDWFAFIDLDIWQGDTSQLDEIDANSKIQVFPSDLSFVETQILFRDLGFTRKGLPRLKLLPGQLGTLESQSSFSYVKSWALETVEPGSQSVLDPEIDTAQEGYRISCLLRQLGKEDYGLQVSVESSEIQRPIATQTMQLQGQDLEISLPELQTTSFAADVRLGVGSTFVLVARADQPEKDLVLLLRFEKEFRQPKSSSQ